MKTKFRNLLAYLLVLMLICSDLAVPVLAEEIVSPVNTLNLPEALQIIEEEAFCGNTSIARVVVPEGTTEIRSRAFADSSLTEIVLSSSLCYIAEDAFEGCGEFAVSAPEGTYAYEWAVRKGYIAPSSATPAEYFETEVLDDGTLAITSYTGTETDIVIPGTISGVQVTRIGVSAFENSMLTSVVIPEGVTAIDAWAFGDCLALETIHLPDSLTYIGTFSFYNCSSLTEITIPEGVTSIGYKAFGDCYNLKTIHLPASLTYIDEFTFDNCSSLTEITIPEGVTSIGFSAFRYCYNLETIHLPASLTYIDEYAFYGCSSLTEITIPEGVTSIGSYAFGDCLALETIHLPDSLTYIDEYAFYGCSSLTIDAPEGSYAYQWVVDQGYIPENSIIESDHPYADNEDRTWEYTHTEDAYALTVTFSSQTQFEQDYDYLILTDAEGTATRYTGNTLSGRTIAVKGNSFTLRMTSDGSETMYGFRITKIETLTEEEYNNFSSFTTSHLSDGTLAVTGYNGFKTDLDIPAEIDGTAVTAIANNAFESSSLTSVTIPEGVTSIGYEAFGYCSNLETIHLPASLTSIGESAFYSCTSLTEITVPDGVTSIGSRAFCGCYNLETIHLPASLTYIDEYTFDSCSSLTGITIPEGVTFIGSYAFSYCYALNTIHLPASLTYINEYAFDGCYNLIIDAPEGSYAYQWAADHGYIPENSIIESDHPYADNEDRTWEYTHTEDAYALAVTFSSRTQFEQDYDYLIVTDAEGIATRYTGSTLSGSTIVVKGNSFTLRITSDDDVNRFGFRITKIETLTEEEYNNFSSFTTSHLSDGTLAVTGYNGFKTDLDIPAEIDGTAVTAIANNAFESSSLTSVTIPEGVTSIGYGAFRYCSNLETIHLPASLTYINEYAFDGCSSLTIDALEGSYAYQWAVDHGYIPENSIIESDHPYADNEDRTWEYTHTEDAYALAVTFSSQTQFEQNWDYLIVTNADGIATRYTGSTLSGRTIAVKGNSFTLRMTSDGGVNRFGFRITKIETLTEEEYNSSGTFTTYLLDDGTLAVTGYNGFKTDLDIPAEIDGTAVTAIADSAFENGSLTSVTIPEGVTSIGSRAFCYCYNLQTIHLPASLTSIDEYAFYNCSSLTEITIPEGVTSIGFYAFGDCNALKSINLPDSVTSIGSGAFVDCYNLQTINLPANLTSIDESAFSNCSSLTELTVPEGVTSIGSYAFRYCYALETIHLPASLTSIDESAFDYCSNLVIHAPEGSYAYQWAADHGMLPEPVVYESEHPYAANTDQTWTHTEQGEDVYAMLVSFSRQTCFGEGDYLTITDADGNTRFYQYSDLRGRTIILPGNTFSLTLHSDDSIEDFGFVITDIQPMTEEEFLNYGEFTCETQEDGTLAITGFTGFRPDLTIPAEIDGTAVTAIASSAFFNDDHLVHVTIPEGVTFIGYSAFRECYNLKTINLPDSITSIGSSAFCYCYNLETINLPAGLTTIDASAFYNCNSLTELTVPDGVTSIGYEAFRYCYNLQTINLPASLTTIGESAFYNCSSLTELTVPEGVTSIESWAFGECYNLETIHLPASLTTIDESAFEGCSSLTIYAPEGSFAYQWAADHGMLPEPVVYESEHPYAANTEQTWTHTEQGEDVYAMLVSFSRQTYFDYGDDLTVTDADGNTRFYQYSDLRGRTIALPGNTFSLTLHSDDSIEGFGFIITDIRPMTEEEFLNYGEFTYATQEDGTLAITGFTGFRPDLTIPAEIDGTAVTAIASNAFYRDDHLVHVTIPEGVTSIGSDAFYYCYNLETINLPAGLTTIGEYAFYNCGGLTEITIPDGVTSISPSAFCYCYNLQTINLPANLTTIDASAFYNCSHLTEITIPEGVTSIGYEAFSDCYALGTIHLPASLTSIDEYAFVNCWSLTTIDAPEGSYAYQWAADHGLLPEPVVYESEHPYAANTDQTWTHTEQGEDVYAMLVSFSRKTYLDLGDYLRVTDVNGNTRYYQYSDLRSRTIALPGNTFSLTLYSDDDYEAFGFIITDIRPMTEEEFLNYGEFTCETQEDGTLAITGFTGFLPDLTIPAEINGTAVTAIASNAFYNDDHLVHVTIPDSVTSIGSDAFHGCYALETIHLPASLTTIGGYAFYNCSGLTEITIPEGVTSIGSDAFSDCYNLQTIHLPDSVTSIGYGAFRYCHNLQTINLPASLTSISGCAFYNCSGLTEITIPEGVTSIEYEAFSDCYALETIHLPASLTSIDESAFDYCSRLTIYAPEGSFAYQWAADHGMLPEPVVYESEHPYAANTDQTWTHTEQGENVYAMLVSFSRQTCFGEGDYLRVTDADGNAINYWYSELRSRTIVLPGNTFSLTLHSDDDYEAFGFTITDIRPMTEEEFLNYGEFTCETQEDGTLAITGFTGFRPDLTIPAEIDGTAVTAIASSAFFEDDHLVHVTIPDSVTSIGPWAFIYCYNLETIHLPANLTTIGEYAFYNCSSLTEITIPEGVTSIGPYAFSECYNLKTIHLPDSVTSIGSWAFCGCNNLQTINLPASLTSIDESAFSYCSSLTEITIPEGVTSIGSWAFGYCYNLQTIHLPASLTYIDEYAFANSPSLTIDAPEGSYAYDWAYENNYLDRAILETEHPYAPSIDQTWEYTHDGEASSLLVTFSRHTYLMSSDRLTVTDANGAESYYYGTDLANQSITVPGNSFTLRLTGDIYGGGSYGFAITKIEALTE